MQCTKIILFTLNIIFWICGVVMLGVGIWVAVNPKFLDIASVVEKTGLETWSLKGGMDDPLLRKAVYLIIGIGAFIMVVGFLGCCGVLKSNKCLILLYTVLVGLTLLVEIVAGIMAAVFMAQINVEIEGNLKNLTKYEYHQNGTLFDEVWNKIQTEMKCCGGKDYQDYNGSYYQITTDHTVPMSCCKNIKDPGDLKKCRSDAAMIGLKESTHLNTQGCYLAMKEWFNSNSIVVLAIAFGVIAIQVLGLVLGCCLRKQIEADNETV